MSPGRQPSNEHLVLPPRHGDACEPVRAHRGDGDESPAERRQEEEHEERHADGSSTGTWAHYGWLALTVLGLVAFVLALAGGSSTRPYGRTMDALHIFTSGFPGAPDDGTSVAMMFARAIAPFVALCITLGLVLGLYRDRVRRAFIRRSSGHIVVCGLGDKGRSSAAAFAGQGTKVVAVDRDPPVDAAGRKVHVLRGDATQGATLGDAAIKRASSLICACGVDDVNIAIATQAAALRRDSSAAPLTALVHVADHDLAEHLRASALALAPLRIEVFNVYDVLAWQLLDSGPLGVGRGRPGRVPHLVVVGDGDLARALILAATRTWHFQARTDALDARLRLTVVAPHAARLCAALSARYPAIERTSLLVPVDASPELDGARSVAHAIDDMHAADVVYLAEPEDSDNMRVAVALERLPISNPAPVVVVRSAFNTGFLSLLPATWAGAGRVDVVTVGPDAYGRKLVVNGAHEAIARAIHESYRRGRLAVAEPDRRAVILAPWDRLEEPHREANRAQADAIVSQLQAAWYRPILLDDWDDDLAEFQPHEVELMAELEHRRWYDEHHAANWTYAASRDDARREHHDMIPWPELPNDRRDIDREFIHTRPVVLAEAGYAIVRDPARRRIAQHVAELYAAREKTTAEWEQLSDEHKGQCLAHADDVPRKLHIIGCRVVAPTVVASTLEFTQMEIELLSEVEHERWMTERRASGWRYGAERDDERRLHPDLVDWAELPEDRRELDRMFIRAIPDMLVRAGVVGVRV